MHRYPLAPTGSPTEVAEGARERQPAARRRVDPSELASWLRERGERLGESWSDELRSRGLGNGSVIDRVVDTLVRRLVDFLPWLLGPYREQAEPLWVRASELFGAMAAKRGLAAGEVIEEFQVLRELVIRDLYRDPPLGGRVPLSLRDILRLNRAIDRGVTHASVGHTDTLFFQFFEAEGQPLALAPDEVAREVETQLEVILGEMRVVVEWASAAGGNHRRP